MFDLKPENYRPHPPEKSDYGIGLIGCGGIANHAHLPAYKQFGYEVVACNDIRREAVEATMQKWGIPKGDTDIGVVIDNPDVDIVDLAVHAKQRLPLVEKIADAGKPILSQKPFAMNLADARKMVEICDKAGVKLMVNQQARWAPAHKALKFVVDSGILGHVYSVMHINRSFQDVQGSWYVALENFNIIDHGIHYIDLSRYFTGLTPQRVKCTTTMVPGQHAVSPMIYTICCEYGADVMSTLHFNNIIQSKGLRSYTWYIDGTEGSAAASQQEMEIAFKDADKQTLKYNIEGRWFPDAFGGSMGEMMLALTENRDPATSGRDNLNSVMIAEAAVLSSETGEAVQLPL